MQKRVTLGEVLLRIDERLSVVGLTDRQASLAAGMSADGIRTMRRQWKAGTQRNATEETLDKLARVLLTTSEWLVYGIGQDDVAKNRVTGKRSFVRTKNRTATLARPLPIYGDVETGRWLENKSRLSEIPEFGAGVPAHPWYSQDQQFAVVVRGNSIDEVAHNGTFLIALNLAASGMKVRDGDLVIIERKRADLCEIAARRYHLDEDGKTAELRHASRDPLFRDAAPLRLPLTDTSGGNADDETEVVIKGVVLAVFTPL